MFNRISDVRKGDTIEVLIPCHEKQEHFLSKKSYYETRPYQKAETAIEIKIKDIDNSFHTLERSSEYSTYRKS